MTDDHESVADNHEQFFVPPGHTVVDVGGLVGRLLTPNEWNVVRFALETQERVMTERGAAPAAEAARLVRAKLAKP